MFIYVRYYIIKAFLYNKESFTSDSLANIAKKRDFEVSIDVSGWPVG